MEKETEEIIKNQIQKLPKEVRELFVDPALSSKVKDIGQKFGLNEEQTETLLTETYLLMLNLTHPDDYVDEIIDRLDLEQDIVEDIANNIISNVLSNTVLEKLKEIYKEEEEPVWQQNLDFILSGGDYTAFLAQSEPQDTPTEPETPLGDQVAKKANPDVTPPSLKDIQAGTKKSANTSNIPDIKDKFTI